MNESQLREALELGRDAAAQVAAEYHESMRGYRADEHARVDADVRKIEEALAALPAPAQQAEPSEAGEFLKRAKQDARDSLDMLYLLSIEAGADKKRASGIAHSLASAVARLSDVADRGWSRERIEAAAYSLGMQYIRQNRARHTLAAIPSENAAPAEPQSQKTWQHAANEWADATCNAVQWLRNIRDGISTPDQSIADMLTQIEHCRSEQPVPAYEQVATPEGDRGPQPQALQLPPLTEVMYHACRGNEYEFSAGGPECVTGYLTDDMLDEIWDQINTALRCAVVPTPAAASQAKPVAWRYRRMYPADDEGPAYISHWFLVAEKPDELPNVCRVVDVEPLYTHPPAP